MLVSMKRTIFQILTIIAATLAVANAVEAAELQKKRSFGLRGEGDAHIQMRSMMAPAKRSKKSRRATQTAVTVILAVKDNKKVGKICNLAPKINDSLMRAWYKKPIPPGYLYDREKRKGKTKVNYRRTPAQRAEDNRLIKVINRAIGANEVHSILVIQGTMRGAGGGLARLPFSSVNGCDELEKSEKKKKRK